jgi:ATP-binding cassette, subfamily B, bacterial HlyB/CyaB
LIFDEATSALDAETAESFARTVNGLKGKVTMLFITHALPKALKIDEVWQIGQDGVQQLKAVPSNPANRALGTTNAGGTAAAQDSAATS